VSMCVCVCVNVCMNAPVLSSDALQLKSIKYMFRFAAAKATGVYIHIYRCMHVCTFSKCYDCTQMHSCAASRLSFSLLQRSRVYISIYTCMFVCQISLITCMYVCVSDMFVCQISLITCMYPCKFSDRYECAFIHIYRKTAQFSDRYE